jgi:hypothetical protein
MLGSLVAVTVSSHTSHVLAQAAPVDRPAEIRGGSCGGLGEVLVPLAHLVLTAGEQQGQTGAVPVEQSGTVVPFHLSDLLSANHAIVVQHSPEQSGVLVACGDIGGALNPDGTLAVGMAGVNGSGLSGVAYFTPIDAFENLLVTVLLVGGETESVTTAAAGADGADGANGAGAQGGDGADGADGLDGADGADGQPGQPGQPGQSSQGGKGGDGGDGGDGGNATN